MGRRGGSSLQDTAPPEQEAQQGQAALLAVTTASSLAHFTQATWDRLWQSGQPRGEGSERPGP